MSVYAEETLRRLPLAEAAYRLLDFATDEGFLRQVFQRHRGASYEKIIGFPLFVQLIRDALLEHEGSGRKSFTRAQTQGDLEASLKAMYGKLARVPLGLSQGLLTEATQRLQAVCPAASGVPLPASVQGFTVLALDGKKLKHVVRRLKLLRPVRGQLLAAKVVVALHLSTGLAVALSADADGEVGDAPLVPDVLAQVRARFPGPRLWVEDRMFCDLVQPRLIREDDDDHFLIRYNAKVSFHRDAQRPVQRGLDAHGRAYEEEWGWLGKATDPRRQYVRRITLYRPGEENVILVTDLLDAVAFPATDLLIVYLQRWGIERVFQRITEVFHLRTLIGTTPQAGVFQAAFCLLLYNLLVVLRGYISAGQQREAETISTENLFYDVQRQWIALHEVLSTAEILRLLDQRLAGSELRQQLQSLLATQWSDLWQKAPTRKRPPKTTGSTIYPKGGHTSVYRLLQEARQNRQIKESAGRK
jgi:hypothetical protein